MAPPPPKSPNLVPDGPRTPPRNVRLIGGIRSQLVSSELIVMGPVFVNFSAWPMYALISPDLGLRRGYTIGGPEQTQSGTTNRRIRLVLESVFALFWLLFCSFGLRDSRHRPTFLILVWACRSRNCSAGDRKGGETSSFGPSGPCTYGHWPAWAQSG